LKRPSPTHKKKRARAVFLIYWETATLRFSLSRSRKSHRSTVARRAPLRWYMGFRFQISVGTFFVVLRACEVCRPSASPSTRLTGRRPAASLATTQNRIQDLSRSETNCTRQFERGLPAQTDVNLVMEFCCSLGN
jgi:hypothetical protein